MKNSNPIYIQTAYAVYRMLTAILRAYSSVKSLVTRCTRFESTAKMSDSLISQYKPPTIIEAQSTHKLTV